MGTTRRIDQLGRVVVPAELRRLLGMKEGDTVEISARDGELVLRLVAPNCAICGRSSGVLVDLHDKHVCSECVDEIRLQSV